jgi:hypothetical protein
LVEARPGVLVGDGRVRFRDVISAVLPERDGEFQYHIPSEAHERAVRESELVEPAATGSPPQ